MGKLPTSHSRDASDPALYIHQLLYLSIKRFDPVVTHTEQHPTLRIRQRALTAALGARLNNSPASRRWQPTS